MDYGYMYVRVKEKELPESSVELKNYITFSDIKVGVPFVGQPIVQDYSGGRVYIFDKDQSILISNAKTTSLLDKIQSANQEYPKYGVDLSAMFDKKILGSDIEFKKAVYNVVPSDIKFFMGEKKLRTIEWSLETKVFLDVFFKASGKPLDQPMNIVVFYGKKFSGLQYSSGSDIKTASIEIDGLPFLRLQNVTQAEIDAVINSIEIVE